MLIRSTLPLLLLLVLASANATDITFVEDQFEIPRGFRVYKVASRDLCGGSYDITFDGEGRLLVGDGKRVRRLVDSDRDGVFDRQEVIAEGLGGRGPQGLLVYGDRLFAVGGDGIQVFEGYRSSEPSTDTSGIRPPRPSGMLSHGGRIGEKFNTGGDHTAHTMFRGHDDYLYFITGDGGGTKDRRHITEKTSPNRRERACSVFRISPDGRDWECVGTGGRNAPNLGMNYLGDLFSLDSDMEWHVDVPWWRPVRLNHWVAGGDQGWQGVGAYPPYYVDNLPGIFDIGRGSPDWGQFYEHEQFPPRYANAYFVADYRSKSASSGGYNTAGRLFVFHLRKSGSRWKAEKEIFAIPKAAAKDENGKPIDFALVDVEIGPDGSLYLSDHNQGVWRIFYDPDRRYSTDSAPPILTHEVETLEYDPLKKLLALQQPMAEWSRLRRERFRAALGASYRKVLREKALDDSISIDVRLRALRYLSVDFRAVDDEFLRSLARDPAWELRAQAAWLMGIRRQPSEASILVKDLISDRDAFVRRRALEALMRNHPEPRWLHYLIVTLEDSDRTVRYAAMMALAHHDTKQWFGAAMKMPSSQARLRALLAADERGQTEPETVRRIIAPMLMSKTSYHREGLLDLLRVLGRFRQILAKGPGSKLVAQSILRGYPHDDRDVRWEQTRLIGEYAIPAGFKLLLARLLNSSDYVEQFHIARALSRVPHGWIADEEARAVRWFLDQQEGWFTEYSGKGRQFPQFWATVVSEFAERHAKAFISNIQNLRLDSLIGRNVLDRVASDETSQEGLFQLYLVRKKPEERRRILDVLSRTESREVSAFVREAYKRSQNSGVKNEALISLARQPPFKENRSYIEEGLFDSNTDVVRACAVSLSRDPGEPSEDICQLLISRMLEKRELFHACERLLTAMSGKKRNGFNPRENVGRNPKDTARSDGLAFWKTWYREEFGATFHPISEEIAEERTNEEIYDFLLDTSSKDGDKKRGLKVYETLCSRCHGGVKIAAETVIFGPDLTGVTRRLNAKEIAEATVYPSKTVADRFKAMTVQVRGGALIEGFVTENGEKSITIVSKDRVHKIPKKKILLMAPQETSLMPEGLLNRLPLAEIRDMMAFLEEVGSRPEPESTKKE